MLGDYFDTTAMRRAIDEAVGWLVLHWGATLEAAFEPLRWFIDALEDALMWPHSLVVVAVVALLAWAGSRSLRTVALLSILMLLLDVLGLWERAMETVALMLASGSIAALIGLPVGIAMAQSKRLRAILLPVLDVMQTMPSFVYLIPFVMLLGAGKVAAALAVIIYAVPPLIRLTDLGLRQVDAEVVEGMRAFGASRRQILVTTQMPLAMPTIMAGVNQMTMMALAMVVIASMIGARGLGHEVMSGIARLEVSRGLLGGIGIVILAIVFDRITQGFGVRSQRHLHLSRS